MVNTNLYAVQSSDVTLPYPVMCTGHRFPDNPGGHRQAWDRCMRGGAKADPTVSCASRRRRRVTRRRMVEGPRGVVAEGRRVNPRACVRLSRIVIGLRLDLRSVADAGFCCRAGATPNESSCNHAEFGVTSFRDLWQALHRRPLAAAATALSLTLLIHFPGRAAGEAPPAPAGPDARPATPSPVQPDRAYADVVKALARLSWLEYEHAQFERAAAQYESAFQGIFSDLKQNKPVQDKGLKLYQNVITNLAKADLDQAIDLSRTPVYDRYPQRPVPGEDAIANESDKANYRRYQSQYITAKSTIDGIKLQYDDEMKRARQVIFGFANEPLRHSGGGDDPNHAAPTSDNGRGRQR